MLKQEKINIADTNMALFGSNIEKEIKKKAANGEPAWKSAGKAVGVEVWRIEKFEVKEWPKKDYGHFYSGDSYIVLHTYKQEDALKYNVHFWLGQFTTLDEAGTAAYKTVELDDFLSGLPVQFREVQGSESKQFLALFDHFQVLEGGVETGFHHVEPEKYKPRLLHIKGKLNNTVVRQVAPSTDSLNAGDTFILDCGLHLYQFNGDSAGAGEKSKAAQLARALDDQRGSKVEIHVLTYNDNDEHAKFFWEFLGGKKAIKTAAEGEKEAVSDEKKRLFKVSDASGNLAFTPVDKFARSSLNSSDVFVVDSIATLFVWIGTGASPQERRSGLQLAQSYLNDQHNRHSVPIVRVLEGGENEEFEASFN